MTSTVSHIAEAPWLQRRDWTKGMIVCSGKAGLLRLLGMDVSGIVGFVLFWLLGQNFIPLALRGQRPFQIFLRMVPFLFLFFAVVLVPLRLWRLFFWLRFGPSVFQMASVPGVIGGSLAGVVRIGRKISWEGGFLVTLECVNQVVIPTKRSTRREEKTLWREERMIALDLAKDDPRQTAIPVSFEIPINCPPADTSDHRNRIVWRLEVRAAGRCSQYKSQFELPIFKTAESDDDAEPDPSVLAPVHTAQTVDYSSHGETDRFEFPGLGNRRDAVICLVVALPMSVILCLILVPQSLPMSASLLPGACMLACCLLSLLYVSRAEISAQRLIITRGFLGRRRCGDVLLHDIQQLETQWCGRNWRRGYQIVANRKSGPPLLVGTSIKGFVLADATRKRMEERIAAHLASREV